MKRARMAQLHAFRAHLRSIRASTIAKP